MPPNRHSTSGKNAKRPPLEAVAHLRRRINDLANLALPGRWAELSGIIREVFARQEADAAKPGAAKPDAAGRAPQSAGFSGRARNVTPAVIAHAARRGEFVRFVMGRACWFCEDTLPVRFISAGAMAHGCSADGLRLTLDGDFNAVAQQATRESIAAGRPFCPGDMGIAIFEAAHVAGFAHCLEIRDHDGALRAGLYGLAQGRGFVILEIFAATPELKRLALDALEMQLARWRYGVLAFSPYARMSEDELSMLGFSAVERNAFADACGANPSTGRHGRWSFDHRAIAGAAMVSSAA